MKSLALSLIFLIPIVTYAQHIESIPNDDFVPLLVDEFQVTSSSSYETSPIFGNDGISDLVVFTVRSPDASGLGDIWYQRIVDRSLFGAPVQVTSEATDDELNDVWGDHIVYTAYDQSGSASGTIMLYQISTATLLPLFSAEIMQEPHIYNNWVVWREGGPFSAQVMMYSLDWLGTDLNPVKIAGPEPPTFQVQIGDRFVVWTEYEDNVGDQGDYDIVIRDLEDATTFPLTNTPLVDESNPSTSGPWVVWSAQTHDLESSTIIAMNADTWETRVIANNGAYNLNPSISGDLIVWESNLNGNMDLFAHQLSTNNTYQVTNHPDDQYLNDVIGDLVVYADNRNGAADIYASPLSSTVYIPDSNFEQALKELGIDRDGVINQQILRGDAQATVSLDVEAKDIVDLTGIESFQNLTTLNCSHNKLTELDVSSCLALTNLRCHFNPILNLELSKNVELEQLICYYNNLTDLDVSKNKDLRLLFCEFNQLTQLNVNGCSSLTSLNCYANYLTSLDLSNCPSLMHMNCHSNQLETLDVTDCKALEILWCPRNNLSYLDVSNNINLKQLSIANMPSLYNVCVWVMPFPPTDLVVEAVNSPNVYYTTDCTIGIGNSHQTSLLIYPNPTDELLTIQTEFQGAQLVEITSLNGQIILNFWMEGTSHQIDLSSFQKGAYFITIRSKDFVTTRKIVKL